MSTLEIATYIGITLALLLGLVIIIGGIVWLLFHRRDEEEDTTDPEADDDGDGDPTPDPDLSPAEKAVVKANAARAADAEAIATLDPKVYNGVRAMLEKADKQLVQSFQREALHPLQRRLRNTRIALAFVTAILLGLVIRLDRITPTETDLVLHGSTTNDAGEVVYITQRLYAIERWQEENTVTSPITHADGVSPTQRSFTSLQDLLTQLSTESYSLFVGYTELEDNIGLTYDIVLGMVPYLDCFTERTSDTPDEQGCYSLTCTLDEDPSGTFTRPHRWNQATSTWTPCE